MDALLKTQTNRKKSRAAIIAAAIGAAICIALSPLLTPQADASLSNGHLCITAKSTNDPEIKSMAGNCKPVEAKQLLVRQATNITINFQASRWKDQPYAVTVLADGVQVAQVEGTTTASGYMSRIVSWDREIEPAASYDLKELRYELTVGNDRVSWTVPVTVFERDTRLPENGEAKAWLDGEVDAGYYGGLILFDIDGTWKLPAGITTG